MTGRKAPWRRAPSELCQLIRVSLMQHCCYMLPWRWDLGHSCCWERCRRLASSGWRLHCASSQEGRRTECSETGPELGAGYRLNAGRPAGAAAACQPSRPEAGGGSSCERCETLSCRTSWSRGRRQRGEAGNLLLGPPWSAVLYSLATQLAGEEASQWVHRKHLFQHKSSVHWLAVGCRLWRKEHLEAGTDFCIPHPSVSLVQLVKWPKLAAGFWSKNQCWDVSKSEHSTFAMTGTK